MEEVKIEENKQQVNSTTTYVSNEFPLPDTLKQFLEIDLILVQDENLLKKRLNEERMKEKDPEKKKIIEQDYRNQLDKIKNEIFSNDNKVKEELTLALEGFFQAQIKKKESEQQLFRLPFVKGIFKKHIQDQCTKLRIFCHQDSKSKQIIVQMVDYSEGLKEEKEKFDKIQQQQQEELLKKQEQEEKLRLKQQIENFKCQPDPVTEIIVTKITKNEKDEQYTYLIEVVPPNNNNSKIIEYRLYMLDRINNEFVKYQTFQTNKISFSVANLSLIFCFKITAINDIGESNLKESKIFKLKSNNFIRGQVLMSGQGDWNQFDIDYFENSQPQIKQKYFDNEKNVFFGFVPIKSFGNIINKVAVQKSCLQLSDEGLLAQQGKSYSHKYSDTENEVQVDQVDDKIDCLFSSSFLRFDFTTPATKVLVNNIATGIDFCVCTNVLGEVYSWGDNSKGQLGLGDRNFRLFPTKISKSLENHFIVDVSASCAHVLALNEEGQVFVWGQDQAITGEQIYDSYGNVCDYVNEGNNQYNPRLFKEILGYYKIIKISAGWQHNAVITEQNELFTWGSNIYGKLGLGDITYQQANARSISLPRKVEYFVEKNLKVTQVSCGKKHTLALVDNQNDNQIKGQLWAWGSSKQGQCGHQDMGSRIQPALVQAVKDESFIQISAGTTHSLALNDKNELFGFGRTSYGALGKQTNGYQNLMIPQKLNKNIVELTDTKKKIRSISAADNISTVLIS